MKKRFKLSKPSSKKMFSKHAKGAHPKNSPNTTPMRGGIRL